MPQTSNPNCIWQRRSSQRDNRKLARPKVSGCWRTATIPPNESRPGGTAEIHPRGADWPNPQRVTRPENIEIIPAVSPDSTRYELGQLALRPTGTTLQ